MSRHVLTRVSHDVHTKYDKLLTTRDDPNGVKEYSEGVSFAIRLLISLAIGAVIISVGLLVYFLLKRRRRSRMLQNQAFEPQRGGLAVPKTEARRGSMSGGSVSAYTINRRLKGFTGLFSREKAPVDEERRKSLKETIGVPRPLSLNSNGYEAVRRNSSELNEGLLPRPAAAAGTAGSRSSVPSSGQFDQDTSYNRLSFEMHAPAAADDTRFSGPRAAPSPPVSALTSRSPSPGARKDPFADDQHSDGLGDFEVVDRNPFEEHNVELRGDTVAPSPLEPFAPAGHRFGPPTRSSSFYPDGPGFDVGDDGRISR